MDILNKLFANLTQKKFYFIVIILLIFITLQLDGLNDKLRLLIELEE